MPIFIFESVRRKRYGFWHFVFDIIMTGITGGVWLVFLLLRYMHTH